MRSALGILLLLVSGQSPITQRMVALFDQLRQADLARSQGKPASRIKFDLPQADINAYMAESLRNTPRPGFKSMTLKFFPANYISTFTLVDFDEIEKMRPGLIPVVLRPVLTGQKTIWIDLRLQAQNGSATYTIEKAYFQSIPLPAVLVQKGIQVVASRQPEHYDTTKPIPLPFGLRRVWTQNGVLSGEN